MKYKFSNATIAILIVVLVILDQITKYIIKYTMDLGDSFQVIGNFFKITYVENPGMAFGVRINNPYIFMALSVLAAVLVFYYLFKLRKESWFLQAALIFISAGAIGNLTDRFIYGRVVDFLDFEFFDIFIPAFNFLGFHFSGYSMTRWPVFNVADMAVTGGMIILIIYLIFVGDPLKNSEKTSESPAEATNG